MILRRCHPIVLAGPAAPTPAELHTARGHAAFEAKRYVEGWHAYKAAYQLDPSPLRAARLAIAAPYATRMSMATDELRQWLVLKRRDARRTGDHEESWSTVEAIVHAFEANARRAEQSHAMQRAELERLEQEVAALKETVQKLEAEPRRFRRPSDRKS